MVWQTLYFNMSNNDVNEHIYYKKGGLTSGPFMGFWETITTFDIIYSTY